VNINDIKNMMRRFDDMINAFLDIAKSLKSIANTLDWIESNNCRYNHEKGK
tara:strand:+ start:617 stop:769 length:153 start_codon:yes stop_codon:yes gene_type:complete